MANDHQNRLEGIRCQDCNKLFFAKTENGLTVWDDRCKKPRLVVELLSEAIEQGYLNPKEVIKNIPVLNEEFRKQISRTVQRLLKPILYKKK